MYEKTCYAGWGDMDWNAHMRNTAYLDKSGDVRMLFFTEHGFSAKDMMQMRFGPVVMKDELEYFREVGLIENVRVTLMLAGLSSDGSRFCIQNEFYLPNGKIAARVRSTGGWLDLNTRKLTAPPLKMLEIMRTLDRTADFQEMPSSLK